MNSYAIDLSRLYYDNKSYVEQGGFTEHFLIGYATSPDFKIELSSILDNTEVSSDLYQTTNISFRSSFLIDQLRINGFMPVRDTTQNKSVESFNKPYAVAKRVVALSTISNSNAISESTFNADIGDYMHFVMPFLDVENTQPRYLHIIVGVLNSSLTESYTPLENWTDVKLYFDFKDFRKLTPNVSDAILQELGSNSLAGTATPLPSVVNLPPNVSGNVGVSQPATILLP